jgi:hypothetical protein
VSAARFRDTESHTAGVGLTYANAGILSLSRCGTEKIQSQDRCLFITIDRHACTVLQKRQAGFRPCAALFASSSSQLPPTRAARGGPCTHTHTADLVRRAGSRPGNTGAAFAAVFTCDGQLLSIQQKSSSPGGRRLSHVPSWSELAAPSRTRRRRGRRAACAIHFAGWSSSSSWLGGSRSIDALVRLRLSFFLCNANLAAARYKTDRAAPRRVAVSSRRLV